MELEVRENISKKVFLQIYFIFFIFLNVIDFLNIIPNDLDFLKKILSWFLIGLIFYRVSPSKLFIGSRIKSIDLAYILVFIFISIPKALKLYVLNLSINVGGQIPEDFNFFFEWFLNLILNINETQFINYFLLLGIFFSILISIRLLNKYEIEENSLIGSLNLSKYFIFLKIHYFILSFVSIFFAMIIANLFLEWFALAVDSLILVIGLFYYLFKYIHDHQYNKTSKYLNKISNTGNNFFQSLILTFSNKKTFFIGVSFLLTLHLLVDIGVFMIPYSFGIQNSLYFQDLNNNEFGREHKPIINIFNLENSQMRVDLINLLNFDSISSNIIITLGVLLLYFINIFLSFVLLSLPFLIYYKNIQNKVISFSKNLVTIFLASIFLYLIIFISSNYLDFYGNLENPINFGTPVGQNIKGIDIYTKPVTEKLLLNDNYIQISIEILLSILIFILLLIFFRKAYDDNIILFQKIISVIVILFFLGYITAFYVNSSKYEYAQIKNDLILSNEDNISTNVIIDDSRKILSFDEVNLIYNNISNFKSERKYNYGGILENLSLRVESFSNISKNKILENYENYETNEQNKQNKHNDYYKLIVNYSSKNKISISNLNTSNSLNFIILNKDLNYLQLNETYIISKLNNFIMFIDLGENYFSRNTRISNKINLSTEILNSIDINYLDEENYNKYLNDEKYLFVANDLIDDFDNIDEDNDKNIVFIIDNIINKFLSYIRFIFLSLFYILGTISFTIFYFKKNLIED